jgi:hypothetical protein
MTTPDIKPAQFTTSALDALPAAMRAWLHASRTHMGQGVYRSPYADGWLYSIYGYGLRSYHQMLSTEKIKNMTNDDIMIYMRSVQDTAAQRARVLSQRKPYCARI